MVTKETNEIIEKAKAAVDDIYANISRIESCQTTLEVLDGAEVLISKDGAISDLHQVLSEYQIADVMATIHGLVKANIAEAAAAIESICGSKVDKNVDTVECDTHLPEIETEEEPQSTILTKCEATSEQCDTHCQDSSEEEPVKEDIEDTEDKPRNNPKASKSTMPPEEEEKLLRKLYVQEQKTVKEIAELMGLSKSNIYDRIKKYGLHNCKYDKLMDSYDQERRKRYQ